MPPAISKNVISSFNKQFSNARDIQWENQANFVKAQFTVNDMVLYAYFNKRRRFDCRYPFYQYQTSYHFTLLTSLKKQIVLELLDE